MDGAVEGLPGDTRMVEDLLHADGLDREQVARVMRITVAEVARHAALARETRMAAMTRAPDPVDDDTYAPLRVVAPQGQASQERARLNRQSDA